MQLQVKLQAAVHPECCGRAVPEAAVWRKAVQAEYFSRWYIDKMRGADLVPMQSPTCFDPLRDPSEFRELS